MRGLIVVIAGLVSFGALAQEVPPMPRPRPADRPAVSAPELPKPAPLAVPEASPTDATPAASPTEATPEAAPSEPAEPPKAPDAPRIYQTACPAVFSGQVEATVLPPIDEGQCKVQSPLSVTGVLVSGRMVPLNAPATIGCPVATALPQWAGAIDGYLWARENAHLTGISVGTSFACRNRNNAETGDISEHGFADAMDVTGFSLSDGRTFALPGGWADALSPEGRALRFAHDSACGLFTTTLGPEANALHSDHIHVDLGCHGKTCTARLCE